MSNNNLISNDDLITVLSDQTNDELHNLILTTIDKVIILKFKNCIEEEHPNKDIDWTYIKDTSNWLEGVLFNENKHFNIKRINNKGFKIAKVSVDLSVADPLNKKYYLLGEPEPIKTYDGWTYISEYKINPYWIPGTFTKKPFISGREILSDVKETGEVYVKSIKFDSFSE